MEGFTTSREHLLAELERVDLLLGALVARARVTHEADDRFQGLCITEEEVDALLTRPAGLPAWAARDGAPEARLRERLAGLGEHIGAQAEASSRAGVRLRLEDLRERFGLDELERDALLVCLAPEVDLRYERLFAYLQDDVTKKRPSVDLVLNLLVSSLDEKLTVLERFRPGAPLVDHGLVVPFDDPHHHAPPLLGKFLKVDDRVVSFLLGSDEIDERLRPFTRLVASPRSLGSLPLADRERERLVAIGEDADVRRDGLLLYLEGPPGSGRRAAAEGLSEALGRKLLIVDLERMIESEPRDVDQDLRAAVREAFFQEASILLQAFDVLLTDGREDLRDAALRDRRPWPGPVFMAGSTPWVPTSRGEVPCLRLTLAAPDYQERIRAWRAELGSSGQFPLEELASKFRLGSDQIRAAVAAAWNLARSREPGAPRLTVEDVAAAARLQSTRGLARLARKIEPRYTWDDIVLPTDRLDLLRDVCKHVRHRSVVYGEWGFDRKSSLAKGSSVLFSGPPGTGKTMAAEILARDLQLELYKIDLSTVVSKYIGETEKNLSRIFAEAETSNAMLFFDEADALFGKRTSVRDSHDRYANIEISYLLQRMEEYEGVVILATNLRKNMDEAFVRRLHFTVEFPFPDEDSRRRIWDGVWPDETPRADEVDSRRLARASELSGASIRNVAITAAFLAAADGRVVTSRHVGEAMRKEHRKMGKMPSRPRVSEGDDMPGTEGP